MHKLHLLFVDLISVSVCRNQQLSHSSCMMYMIPSHHLAAAGPFWMLALAVCTPVKWCHSNRDKMNLSGGPIQSDSEHTQVCLYANVLATSTH